MTQDLEQVRGWLRMVCPANTPGQLWVGSAGSNFRGRRFHPSDYDGILREVIARDRDPGIFLRMGTIRHDAAATGRGTAAESQTLFGLWADLDIAGPGHKHDPGKYQGRGLPPDEDTARALVEHLPEPTAWHMSGGGLYAYWLPTEGPWDVINGDQRDRLEKMSVRLQESIAARAALLGYHYGTGVGDLARILRLPGTVNRKVPGHPVQAIVLSGWGPRYEIDELDAAIPQLPEAPGRGMASSGGLGGPRTLPGIVVGTTTPPGAPGRFQGSGLRSPSSPYDDAPGRRGPFDEYADGNDLVDLLVQDGWQIHGRRGDNTDLTRPGKNVRDGLSANVRTMPDGRQVLWVFSDDAGLPTQRAMTPGDWYAQRYCGGDPRMAGRALRAQGYGSLPERPTVSSGYSGATPAASGASGAIGLPMAPEAEVGGLAAKMEPLWVLSPWLHDISVWARARLVSPWAVLGSVLAQVDCRIGPHIQLPPVTGGNASLNLLVGLVGESGSGKGGAQRVAREYLNLLTPTPLHKPGTGQGVEAAFSASGKDGTVQFNDVALFVEDEISIIGGHTRMAGSTLLPTLCEVYSGEKLGAHYADNKKRRVTEEHRYRAALVVGIQPARSGVLFEDAEGGTPQRFLWMPAWDEAAPEMPEDDDEIPTSLPRTWKWQDYQSVAPTGELPTDQQVPYRDVEVMKVCRSARQQIRTIRKRRVRQRMVGGVEGHLLLTRLKVAAVVSFMQQRGGQLEVTEWDWEVAGCIMAVSSDVRDYCQQVLRDARAQEVEARGRADGVREIARDSVLAVHSETEETRARTAIADRILTMMAASRDDGWVSTRDLTNGVTSRLKKLVPVREVIDSLVSTGVLEGRQEGQTTRYRPRSR